MPSRRTRVVQRKQRTWLAVSIMSPNCLTEASVWDGANCGLSRYDRRNNLWRR